MDRSKSLVKNTLILGIGTIFSKCLVFIMIPFFSKWLSRADYGTFDLYLTYISLMIPLFTVSCGEAVFRYMIDEEECYDKKQVVSTGNALVTCGSIIGSICIAVVWVVTGQNYLIPFLCCLLAEVINNYLQSVMRGLKRLDIFAISNVICMMLIAVFVTLFVKFMGLGLAGMLYGYALAYLVNDIYMAVAGKVWKCSNFKSISKDCLKTIVKFSIPLMPNAIAWWIVNASDRLIIKGALGADYNGVYAIANKIPQICTVLFSVFQVSWNQNASESINDEDRNEYFSSVLNNMTKIIISICLCVISVNFIVFDYIMEPEYYAAYYQVPVLVVATIFTAISTYFGGIFIGLKRPKVNGVTTLMAAAINITANVLFINVLGLYAASGSTLIAFIALCAVRWIYMNKEIKVRLNLSTYIYIGWLIYFVVMVYINNSILNITNIVLAMIIFIYTNRGFMMKFVNKMKKKVLKK